MGFCPFYDLQCPEDSSCAVWKSYGCSACCKPGIPAMHSGDLVFILDIKVGEPKTVKEVLVIYSDYETGVIGYEAGDEEVLDNFVVIE